MDLIEVKTAIACPSCGDALELVEDERHVWLGCRRCVRYVRRDKREAVKRHLDYRERRFNWVGLMAELYWLYVK